MARVPAAQEGPAGVTIDLPEQATPQLVAALDELVRRAAQGFTGGLTFNLSEGVPIDLKATECRRFKARPKVSPLTRRGP